ncbi:MAG: hypothetical protein L0214_07600 [candidate division NC10 bacterium]|nr:hypothetical protein [candidate division NC10 bacterium]
MTTGRSSDGPQAWDARTGEPVEVEIVEPPKLTPAQREARRLARRTERGQHAQAIRVLRAANRKMQRGRPEEGVRVLLEGFGQILADAVVRRLAGRG